jgi:hypothetical protein
MSRHERWCNYNPENRRKCEGCVNLEEIEIEYTQFYFDGYGESEIPKKTTGFYCKKLDKKLYPLKVEKKDLVGKYPETFHDQEPMPKECEHFNSELPF